MLGEKYHISHFPSLFSFSSYSNPEWLFRPRLYGKWREALYNFDTFHSLCLYPVFKVCIDRQPFSLDFHTFKEYSSILFRSWSTSVSLLRKLIPSFFLPSSSHHFYFPDFPINLRMMMISFSRENGNLIYVPVFRGSLVFPVVCGGSSVVVFVRSKVNWVFFLPFPYYTLVGNRLASPPSGGQARCHFSDRSIDVYPLLIAVSPPSSLHQQRRIHQRWLLKKVTKF